MKGGKSVKPPTPRGGTGTTILSQRHYKKVCAFCWSAYVVSFIAVGLNQLLGNNSICHDSFQPAAWTRDFNIATCGGFAVAVALQMNRIFLSTFREENDIGTLSSYYASLVVNIIAAISHFSTLLFKWGGICRDPFGVLTPGAIWPEWAITVPFLAFITLSVDDKPFLSNEDVASIISLYLCIVAGSLLQLTRSKMLGVALLSLSCIFCIPSLVIIHRSDTELSALLSKSTQNESKRGLYQRKILLASRKATLSHCVGYLLQVFPLMYFLRLTGIINDDVYFVGIVFASAFTKVLFASLCMDAHLEVSHPAIALIDAENFAHTSRRAFLRYVFHEVRVPLNSIALGIQILENSPQLDETETETVTMVKEAVAFMGETLNDVMALQKVEEGSMELIYKSFSIVDLFQNVEDSFIDVSVEYGVALSTEIDNKIPERVIGDKFRIRHVLANLVSNALKHSTADGLVQLKAELALSEVEDHSCPMVDTGRFVMITFSVIDEGSGISEEDQLEDIFQPYRTLKSGELKSGRGSGLGLAICREIVHMHGGKIWYSSTLGKGSTFFVSLPLEISSETKHNTWQNHHRKPSRRLRKTSLSSHLNVLLAKSPGGVATPMNSNRTSGAYFISPFSRQGSVSPINEDVDTPDDDAGNVEVISAFGDDMNSDQLHEMLMNSTIDDSPIRDKSHSHSGSFRSSHPALQRITVSANPQHSNSSGMVTFRSIDNNDEALETQPVTGERSSRNSSEQSSTPSSSEGLSFNLSKTMSNSPSFHHTSISSMQLEIDISGKSSNKIEEAVLIGVELSIPPGGVSRTTSRSDSSYHNGIAIASTNGASPSPSGRKDTRRFINNRSRPPPPMPMMQQALESSFLSADPKSSQSFDCLSSLPQTPNVMGMAHTYSFFNVLIVDDVVSNRKLLALLLNKKGIHSIAFAEDGAIAVDSVQVKGIDAFEIIFMDNTMPNMVSTVYVFLTVALADHAVCVVDWIAATRKIRELGHENLIVGVTGNSMEDELEDFIRAGADLVITKPMKPHVLDSLLQFANQFGCRSHSDQKLVISDSSLKWVECDK